MIKIDIVEAKSILSKSKLPTADYVINPYVGCPHRCIYCYAEFMKRFTHHDEPWGDFLDVKTYSRKINPAKLAGQAIVFGSVTDVYNPFERKYRCTRGILEQLEGVKAHVDILTKSDLVLRDVDVIKKIPDVTVGISLNTLDDSIRKKTEPGAPSISRRLEALKRLHEEGISTWLFISPMFPGITDFKEIVSAARSFVDLFTFENLNLRGAYYPRVMAYIREYHPDLLPLYLEIYKDKNIQYWEIMEKEIHAWCRKEKIRYRSFFYHEKIRKK
jgi:DNA repair photolyase